MNQKQARRVYETEFLRLVFFLSTNERLKKRKKKAVLLPWFSIMRRTRIS
jgi:hypothetical protein